MSTRRRRRLAAGTAVGVAGYAWLQWAGRTAGASRDERQGPLPGDELVDHPMLVTTHAITMRATPDEVWPWLVQMGWHRAGWYTARWVDRLLFPANLPSADRIVPEWQDLAVGDWVPDGAPETRCGFVVRQLDPGRQLVLHSTEHLPPEFQERFGAWIDWSWAFVLRPAGEHTRFVFRSRARLGPPWLAAAYQAVVVPADYVMSRQMLQGLQQRVEATAMGNPTAHR